MSAMPGISTGRRTKPPFRADHVGSLLRPPRLLRARSDFAAGAIEAAELHAVEDEEIERIVQMQHDVGLQTATDGEFRRGSWHMDFIYRLGGIERVEDAQVSVFRNDSGTIEFTPSAIAVTGRVGLEETIFARDFEYLRSVTPAGMTPKLTIPSPNMVHYRHGQAAIRPGVYDEMDAFWADLTTAYADEVQNLAQLGCEYLQFDDISLAYLNDPAQRQELAGRGEDAAHLHERYVRNLNAALAGRGGWGSGLTITTHLCRGNFRSSWVAEGGYDYVAEVLFGGLDVDGFFLEYDDDRSGGFEPLRFVPPGKMVVLGLVTSKRAKLERRDQLVRRIEEAARYVPVEQLCLSPQCGFSSTVEGNALTYEEQVAKLELVVEVAREVWG